MALSSHPHCVAYITVLILKIGELRPNQKERLGQISTENKQQSGEKTWAFWPRLHRRVAAGEDSLHPGMLWPDLLPLRVSPENQICVPFAHQETHIHQDGKSVF